MRKLCITELFTVKRVQSFWHVRDAEVSKLIDSLSQFEGKSINLSEKVFHLSNEIICQIAFGKSYQGKQFKNANFEEVLNEVFAMLNGFWTADFFPTFGWIIDMLMGLHKRLDKAFTNLDGFLVRVIEEHLKPGRENLEHKDLADILLGLSNDQTCPVRLDRDNVKAVLMDMFAAGVDTSSIAVAWAMTELVKNPRAMKKVQAEIRNVIGRKPKANENEIQKLLYLKMVVKETFRLHPPVTLIHRETMKHCKIGGYDVFPKTRVLVGAWAIGRDPHTWKDPEEFYPERFEDNDIDFKGANFELLPFGAGRRICPGLSMGATTVEFTLANLLHCFDWELPPGMKIEDISMEEEAGLTAHKKLPLYLVPIKYKWEDVV